MSEVKLVIRDANEDRSGTVHGSVAAWFVAALGAELRHHLSSFTDLADEASCGNWHADEDNVPF